MTDAVAAKKLVSEERNIRISAYINEHILDLNILKVLRLASNDKCLVIKKLPYAQAYDFIDKHLNDADENKKSIFIYYSFASSNNQKHISQIIQSQVLAKEYVQFNKLYNYDEYVRVDELLKIDSKQNIPILFTIFVKKTSPELKEYTLKLLNNLKFNEN
ncbi:hypothetical protein QEN19_003833 [Hanseniaspora menglaensis]